MGHNLLTNAIYWGYNPLSSLLHPFTNCWMATSNPKGNHGPKTRRKYWDKLNYQPQLVSSTGFLVAINSSQGEWAIWVARDESYFPKQTRRTKSQNHQNRRVDKTMKCQATNPIPHHVSQIGSDDYGWVCHVQIYGWCVAPRLKGSAI